jgi:hypothetical protein
MFAHIDPMFGNPQNLELLRSTNGEVPAATERSAIGGLSYRSSPDSLRPVLVSGLASWASCGPRNLWTPRRS